MDEIARKVYDSGLIRKCSRIAQKLGTVTKSNDGWATANYSFRGPGINIVQDVYAMGDSEFKVSNERETVFHARELKNNPPTNPERVVETKLIGQVFAGKFEVLAYIPGQWIIDVERLHISTIQII